MNTNASVNNINETTHNADSQSVPAKSRGFRTKVWIGSTVVMTAFAMASVIGLNAEATAQAPQASAPAITVSSPLQRDLDVQLGLLGQFSAVQKVELRAQVGGILNEIHFNDGDIVKKGDLLFVIDAEPYAIKLSQVKAQLASANARLELATREQARAETLKSTDAGSVQNVEQSYAERLAAQAAVDSAKALVRDAQWDLDHTRVTAPFTGRIGNHQVSVGNLVAGSRAGASATTLLTTLVSMDPIYLDFDMSESDYSTFMQGRGHDRIQDSDKVAISVGSDTGYAVEGRLDFIDNALDRSSGTIHARAIVANSDYGLTPGGFGRIRLSVSKPTATLLVPDVAVLPDLSDHIVLTVGADDVVQPKRVELGELRGGLRVIRSGLTPSDRVVIDSIPLARPGSKVAPQSGSIAFAGENKG